MDFVRAFSTPDCNKMLYGRYINCGKLPAFAVGLLHLVLLLGMMIYCAAALNKYASCSLPIIFAFYVPYFVAVAIDSHILFFEIIIFGVMVQACNVIGVCLCLRHFFMHLTYFVAAENQAAPVPLPEGIVKEKNLWAGIILFILFLCATDFALSVYVSYWRYLEKKASSGRAAVTPSTGDVEGVAPTSQRHQPLASLTGKQLSERGNKEATVRNATQMAEKRPAEREFTKQSEETASAVSADSPPNVNRYGVAGAEDDGDFDDDNVGYARVDTGRHADSAPSRLRKSQEVDDSDKTSDIDDC